MKFLSSKYILFLSIPIVLIFDVYIFFQGGPGCNLMAVDTSFFCRVLMNFEFPLVIFQVMTLIFAFLFQFISKKTSKIMIRLYIFIFSIQVLAMLLYSISTLF